MLACINGIALAARDQYILSACNNGLQHAASLSQHVLKGLQHAVSVSQRLTYINGIAVRGQRAFTGLQHAANVSQRTITGLQHAVCPY